MSYAQNVGNAYWGASYFLVKLNSPVSVQPNADGFNSILYSKVDLFVVKNFALDNSRLDVPNVLNITVFVNTDVEI